MADYKRLEGMLCDELDELTHKGDMSAGSLDAINKLTHSIKSLKTIEAMDGSGYSGYNSADSYFDDGMSGARGRGTYARRDSMGRYADDGYSGRRRYSRDGEKEALMQGLEQMKRKLEKMGD